MILNDFLSTIDDWVIFELKVYHMDTCCLEQVFQGTAIDNNLPLKEIIFEYGDSKIINLYPCIQYNEVGYKLFIVVEISV